MAGEEIDVKCSAPSGDRQRGTSGKRPLVRWLFFAYIVGLHALTVYVLVKSDFLLRARSRLTSTSTVDSELNEYFWRTVHNHERMDSQVPSGFVIFVGDSITQGLCVDSVKSPAVNFGIGSDTTIGVLARLPKWYRQN